MKKIILRDEQQYVDVEQFNSYELTNCIAFEMAIRNKNVLDLLEYINSFVQELLITQSFEEMGLQNHYDFSKLDEYQKILLNDYYIITIGYDNWLEFYNFTKFYIKNSKFLYTSHECIDPYYAQGKLFLNDVIKEGAYICTETTDFNKCLYDDLANNTIREGFKIQNFRKYLPENPLLNHNITPIFSRPTLKVPNNKSKEVNLEKFNLNLPLNELLEYIKLLKKHFEESHEIIQTPIEILGKKLNKIDHEICITRPRGAKECFDMRQHMSTQIKFADMFYIYDALNVGMSKSLIQMKLSYYYESKGEKLSLFDQKTIIKYHNIAKEYIDNLKYRELVLGFSHDTISE